jgi:hypothetical protein
MSLHIINDGMDINLDDCCPELGRTHFEDDHIQVADIPSVANVLISEAEYDAYRECANLLRFLDDPKAMVDLTLCIDTADNTEYHACAFRDPFTGRGGVEYGDTPSEAMTAALRTITHYRKQREQKEAA